MKILAGWGGARWAALLAVTFLTLANVSHTIALRYLLLVVLLCWMMADRNLLGQSLRSMRPAYWLALFLGYGFLHSTLVSAWPLLSLSEWRSQLLMGGGWFLGGVVLFRKQRALSIMDCVVLAGCLLVGAELAMSVQYRWLNGVWLYNEVFTTATKLEFTFFVNFVMVFLAVLTGFGKGKTCYPIWLLLLAGALMFFASFQAGARNGLIGLAYLVVSFTLIYIVTHRHQLGSARLFALIVLVVLGLGGFMLNAIKKDPRNVVFIESATIAWHDEAGKGWLRMGPLPRLADGNEVDGSAYERVSWIRGGLDLISRNPWGYGYGRRAFSQALEISGHPNNVGHSHSGLIDLGVGLGLPGIILWLCFCISLVWQGYKAFLRRKDIAGLALMLLASGFVGRMMMESINKDHMLHLFLFVVGALLACMQLNRELADE